MTYATQPRATLRGSYPLMRGRLAGLGAGTQGPSTTQLVQQVGSVATTATTAIIAATSHAAIAAGGVGLVLGMTPALAIPIIGAAITGVTIAIVAILNSGCGQTCIITSDWANQAADALEQNIRAYFALPAPRPVEAKAQALANFDNIWAALQQKCGQPQWGNAGVRCISDRMAGACTWHQTGNPEFPGQPTTGACWNWFNSYRDPIDQDPAVVTQTTVNPQGAIQQAADAAGSAGTGASVGGLDLSTLALFGGAGILLLGLAGGAR